MSSLHLISQEENRHDREPYEAYKVGSRRQLKLMLVDGKGKVIGMPSYSYYVDAFCTSDRYVWLLFSTTAFRIKGRNLPEDLLTYVQDDRLKALYCYSPDRYEQPEAEVVLVESITRHTLKEFVMEQQGDPTQ